MGFFSSNIGIDLGTANILVHVQNKGIVLDEPSVVAVNSSTNKVLAIGNEAKEMLGRTPGNIVAVRPLKGGVIADFDITQLMLRHCIKKVTTNMFFKPSVVVGIPSGITEVEKRAVEEAVLRAGARRTYLIDEPMAAAIGAGLPVGDPTGSMIVDIGGGTSEVAVISLGGIVESQSIRVAGDAFDAAIMNYIKKKYNLMTGERTSEAIKCEIGCVRGFSSNDSAEVRGRDLVSGLPTNLTITAREMAEALDECVSIIIDGIKATLEKTPPELSSDIAQRGIVLAGGGALLRGLDKLIEKETGIDVHIAPNPLKCVALGTGKVLDEVNNLEDVLTRIARR